MTLEATQPTDHHRDDRAGGRALGADRRRLVIGRDGADLTIADDGSRRHAVLRATEAGVVIEDLRSLNGTFVNDERISVATTLSPTTGSAWASRG
jgi:pSer/pThr/pTyr-binding forkhead associated (FHA) protein